MEALVPEQKIRQVNRPPFRQYLQAYAPAGTATFAVIEEAFEAYCAHHLQATYYAAINFTKATYLPEEAFTEAKAKLKSLEGDARRAFFRGFIISLDQLIDKIEELGNDYLRCVDTQRDGKEALAKAKSKEKRDEPTIHGVRVRHYTNLHSIGPITSSGGLRIFSAQSSPFGKASDKGVIFAMPSVHFRYLDNMQPNQIKEEFLIKGQNECRAFVEFNLEESVAASSGIGNKMIKQNFVKQQVELQLTEGVPNLEQREPVWYTYRHGSWEVVRGECPWGEDNADYLAEQNTIVVKQAATKLSSSNDEKSPQMSRKGGPRDGRGAAGQGSGGKSNYGPNDNNAKQ